MSWKKMGKSFQLYSRARQNQRTADAAWRSLHELAEVADWDVDRMVQATSAPGGDEQTDEPPDVERHPAAAWVRGLTCSSERAETYVDDLVAGEKRTVVNAALARNVVDAFDRSDRTDDLVEQAQLHFFEIVLGRRNIRAPAREQMKEGTDQAQGSNTSRS